MTKSRWPEYGMKTITPLSRDTPDSPWDMQRKSMMPIKEAIPEDQHSLLIERMIKSCDAVVSQIPEYRHGFLFMFRPDKEKSKE